MFIRVFNNIFDSKFIRSIKLKENDHPEYHSDQLTGVVTIKHIIIETDTGTHIVRPEYGGSLNIDDDIRMYNSMIDEEFSKLAEVLL